MASLAPHDLVRHIFEQAGFSFLRVDLVGLANVLNHAEIGTGTHLLASLSDKTDRYSYFVAAMHGLLRSVDVPRHFAELFADTPILRDERQCSSRLAEFISNPNAPVMYRQTNEGLLWDEVTPWPVAYGPFISQLMSLTWLYQRLILNRKAEMAAELEKAGYAAENISILDQSSRVLPSKLHYAFASFGAWLGGAENWQYLGYFATEPQIRESSTNIGYAKRILYSDQDAAALDAGGMIAVPASLALPLLELQQSSVPVLGGIPVDETNAANAPTSGPNARPDIDGPDGRPGFLLDKNYRAVFFARTLENRALYGASNALRDHYDTFYKNVEQVGLVRCKHYCSPIIEVGSIDELKVLAATIPVHSEEGVFFRGQSSMYTLNRPQPVRDVLFGLPAPQSPASLLRPVATDLIMTLYTSRCDTTSSTSS